MCNVYNMPHSFSVAVNISKVKGGMPVTHGEHQHLAVNIWIRRPTHRHTEYCPSQPPTLHSDTHARKPDVTVPPKCYAFRERYYTAGLSRQVGSWSRTRSDFLGRPPPSILPRCYAWHVSKSDQFRSLFKERSDYSKLAKNSTSVLWEMEWLHIEAQYVMTPLARSWQPSDSLNIV